MFNKLWYILFTPDNTLKLLKTKNIQCYNDLTDDKVKCATGYCSLLLGVPNCVGALVWVLAFSTPDKILLTVMSVTIIT